MKAGPVSFAAGCWAAGWIVLPFSAYLQVDTAATADAMLLPQAAAARVGLSPGELLGLLAGLAFLAVCGLSLMLIGTVRLLDPARVTLAALGWAMRTWRCSAAWVLLLAVAVAAAVVVDSPWAFAPSIAVYALLPFLCLRGDIVAMAHPPALWAPRWPGVYPLALGGAWFALSFADDLLAPSLPDAGRHWANAVLIVAYEGLAWAAGLALIAASTGAWLRRTRDDPDAPRQRLLLPRVLVALVAFELRVAWMLVVLLLVPALSLAVHAIFVFPEIASNLQQLDQPSPPLLAFLEWFAGVSGDSWWLVALLSMWPLLAWQARVVHLAASTGSRSFDTG